MNLHLNHNRTQNGKSNTKFENWEQEILESSQTYSLPIIRDCKIFKTFTKHETLYHKLINTDNLICK